MRIAPALATCFILLALVFSQFSYAQTGITQSNEVTFRTLILPSSKDTTASARLSYINFSYYLERYPQTFPKQLAQYINPNAQYSDQGILYSTKPLPNAEVEFTFEGNAITDADGVPVCDKVVTDSEGRAECRVDFFNYLAKGTITNIQDYSSCGSVEIHYKGGFLPGTSIKFQPSTTNVLICPENSPALTALGSALTSSILNNYRMCFPLMIILGLLVSSMYYSGRDPMSLFDITTPRIPKGKPFRVNAGQAPMMLRSLTKTLQNNVRVTKADIRKVTEGYFSTYARAMGYDAARKKAERSQLRRKLKELFAEHENLVRNIIDKTNFDENAFGQKLDYILAKYALIMSKYNPNEIAKVMSNGDARRQAELEKSKSFKNAKNMYENIVMNEVGSKFALNLNFEQTKKMLGTSRSRRPGIIGKNITKAFDGLTNLQLKADEMAGRVRVPIIGPLVRGVLYSPVKFGFKAFDAVAQHRSSSIAAFSGMRDLYGSTWYNLGHNKEGKANPFGRIHRGIYDSASGSDRKATWIGKLYAKYHDLGNTDAWTSLVKRYDLNNKVATPIKDDVENYRRPLVSYFNALMDIELSRVGAEVFEPSTKGGKIGEEDKEKYKSILIDKNRSNVNKLKDLIEHLRATKPDALVRLGIGDRYLDDIKELESAIQGLQVYVDSKGRYQVLTERSISENAFNDLQKTIKDPGVLEQSVKAEREARITRFKTDYALLGERLSHELDITHSNSNNTLRIRMNNFVDSINEAVMRGNGRNDDEYLKRINPLGQHVAGAYLTEMLRPILFSGNTPLFDGELRISGRLITNPRDFRIRNINEFEEVFSKGAGSPRFKLALMSAYQQGTFTSLKDEVEQHITDIRAGKYGKQAAELRNDKGDLTHAAIQAVLLEHALSRQANHATNLYRTGRLLGVDLKNEKAIQSAFSDKQMSEDFNFVKKKAELNQAFEFAALREENKLSDYHRLRGFGQYIENLLDANRRYARLSGFLVSMNDKNSPWGAGGAVGESLLGQADTTFRERIQSYNTTRAIFLNKVSKDSALYDEEFRNNLKNARYMNENFGARALTDAEIDSAIRTGTMPFNAYQYLQKRGLTFKDARQIEFFMSGDLKGGVVLMEYDQDRLDARYKNDPLKLDGTFKRGIIIEKSRQGADGKTVHDIRDLAPMMAETLTSGYSNLQHCPQIQIKDESTGKWRIINPMSDNRKSNDPTIIAMMEASKANEGMRVRIARALAGFDENGGYHSEMQKLRVLSLNDFRAENGTTRKDKAKDALGRVVYGAFYDRFEKVNEWYAVQAVTRSVVTQYLKRTDQWATEGADRFSIGKAKGEEGEGALSRLREQHNEKHTVANTKVVPEKWKDAIKTLQIEAEKSQPRFFLNLKRQYASRTLSAIAEAEADAVAANCEWKAINKMSASQLKLTSAEFIEFKREIDDNRKQYKSDFKITKQDYKELGSAILPWSGTHVDEFGSKRNLITRSYLFSKLLDSAPYSMGRWRELWFAVESATMRSTDTAVGQRYGFSGTIATALETGQGAYEPTHMWLNAGMWEKGMKPAVNASRSIHRLFAPYASSLYRGLAGMPSYLQKTEMEGFEMGHDRIKWYAAVPRALLGPLWSNQMGDFMADTKRRTFDLFGISSAMQAYSNYSKELNQSNWVTRNHMVSPHSHADAQAPAMQRYLDKFSEFENRLDNIMVNNRKLRDHFNEYMNETDEKKKISIYQNVISKHLPQGMMVDERAPLVQQAKGAGAYFFEDGSRNRFMNLFISHHQNIWRWIIPDMVELDPLGGVLNISPMVANTILLAKSGHAVGVAKSGATAVDFKYDKDSGGFDMTKYDMSGLEREGFREVYNKNQSALMQSLEHQSNSIMYTGWNTYRGVIKRILHSSLGKYYPPKQGAPATYELSNFLSNNIGASMDELQNSVVERGKRWSSEYKTDDTQLGMFKEYVASKPWYKRNFERMTDPYKHHNTSYHALLKTGLRLSTMFGADAAFSDKFRGQFSEKNIARKNMHITYQVLKRAQADLDFQNREGGV